MSIHIPPRFTVRQLMVAVAIVGIVLGVKMERHHLSGKIATHHRAEFEKLVRRLPQIGYEDTSDDSIWPRIEGHEPMRFNCERATRYPWPPVEPDRPEPR